LQTQPKSAEVTTDLQLEIAHLLLIDVVGYSKLIANEQIELLQELNRIVRNTECFRAAEKSGKLIRVPTGDGMALLFFRSPEEPVQCALEISAALKNESKIQLRMGVHSGPINQVTDVNDQINVAGAGINMAQRVMDCGDAGHILLSGHIAEDLAQYRHWRPYLHDLGECEVKHGLRLKIVNLYKDNLGNLRLPEKLKRGRRWKQMSSPVRSVGTPRWPQLALLVLVLLSGVTLAITFSIFFRRAAPMPASLSRETIANASRPIAEKSIAVLPFVNMSDDKQNAYFADGVQDEILSDLAKVADLKVISRTSVMQYRTDAKRNLREIAKELGVTHMVEGSVQRVGRRMRVSAQLIDARTDTHVWGERYDRDVVDVFAIESELAEKIVAQLKGKVSPTEKSAIEQKPTSDLEAYDLYLHAKNLIATAVYTHSEANRSQAIELLNEAIVRDPNFFLAYCQLADVHDQFYFFGIDHTPHRLALADAAIESAARLQPDAGETHLARAVHLYRGYLDYDGARREVILARTTLPNDAFVFELSGFIDRRQGHWDQSLRHLEQAVELDPRNFYFLQELSQSYQKLRRFVDAAAIMDRALAVVPDDLGARMHRASLEFEWRANTKPFHAAIYSILAEKPDEATAIAHEWLHLALCERDFAAAERALAAIPPDGGRDESFTFPPAWYAGLVARARGDSRVAQVAFTRARAQLQEIVAKQPEFAEPMSLLGVVDAALGRKEEAIREGRRAFELLPITKDSINGAMVLEFLAVTYTWTGEKDLALKQLDLVARTPSDFSYGRLRLHPFWDPLRGDPRFEKIVASLAPK
jgi:TolB-like protein/class 3 adenylate cyclase/Tfp pilus assembly protein PilF